ncbi:MAG TPA: nuclear transport factor 2 family protein [Roseiarcus sp.]|jgi:ketosteroid isomerase-like protein
MTNRDVIGELVRSVYAARVRGDVEGTLAGFTDDVIFEINGRGIGQPNLGGPIEGKAALRPVMQGLIHDFRFSNWRQVSLIVDGDEVAHHWRATVATPAGKSAEFDVFDFMTIREGKIATFRQSTDTAMIVALVGA